MNISKAMPKQQEDEQKKPILQVPKEEKKTAMIMKSKSS